jgi:peroxiredoxin
VNVRTTLAAIAFLTLLVAQPLRADDKSPSDAPGLAIGATAHATDVRMKNVDGKEVSIADAAKAKGTLVVFTCNHCPFAQAWESRIVAMGKAALSKDIGVIAVNANDPGVVPEDGFDAMQARAKEKGYSFPYVVDSTSDVARAFGAKRTPEAFLLDASGKLVYHGAIDDNAQDADAVRDHFLRDAIDALADGKPIAHSETKAIGCGIKFHIKA